MLRPRLIGPVDGLWCVLLLDGWRIVDNSPWGLEWEAREYLKNYAALGAWHLS